MHHKPINPARRDGGERQGGRGKDGESGTEGIQQETDMEGRKMRCKYGWWLTAEWEQKNTKREWEGGNAKIRREQRECQKAEIVKYREIEREKTNVSPWGLTLSFLYGEEWKKEDFHLLSSQPPFDISLFLSHILISFVSIHRVGTDSLGLLKHEHTWLT